jgi:hypothetical protein
MNHVAFPEALARGIRQWTGHCLPISDSRTAKCADWDQGLVLYSLVRREDYVRTMTLRNMVTIKRGGRASAPEISHLI